MRIGEAIHTAIAWAWHGRTRNDADWQESKSWRRYRNAIHNEFSAEATDKIIEIVARVYGVSAGQIKSRRGTHKTALARHVAMFIATSLVNETVSKLAKAFNASHPQTIHFARRRIEKMCTESAKFKSAVDRLTKEIIDELRGRA